MKASDRTRRAFTAAPQDTRCCATIRLRDGSLADCMRHRKAGRGGPWYYCEQHTRIYGRIIGMRKPVTK